MPGTNEFGEGRSVGAASDPVEPDEERPAELGAHDVASSVAMGYGLVAVAAGILAADRSSELATPDWGVQSPVAPATPAPVLPPPVRPLPPSRVAALPASSATRGVLLPADVGPGVLLRTMRSVDPGTAVYVVSPGEAAALQRPAVAGAVVLARRTGAVLLDAASPGQAVRNAGLARRHRSLDLIVPGAGHDARALPPPPAFRAPTRVPVPCRIVAEEADDRYVVAVGRPPVHRLVPRALVTACAAGEGLIRCEVVARAGRLLTVDVPGVPLDDALFAQLELDDWLEGFVRARGRAAPAPAAPVVLAALPAPRTMTIGVLIASKNGEGSIGDTIRSAVDQAEVYVVSDGSTDETAAAAAHAGAYVLALEQNVGKPTALRTAIHHFGLTRRYDALAILDDDTLIARDFVDQARGRLEPGVAIVVGQTMTRWTDHHRWNVWLGSRAYAYWRYQATLRRGQSAFNVMTCISGSNSLYRSELLDQVLVEHTPYIVDDTYWTLETHRRKLGRIVYVPEAKASICDPTNLRDWYKQNLRWMWGSFQGIWGHRIGLRPSLLDATYALLILDWLMYVLLAPLLVVLALSRGWVEPGALATVSLVGYSVGAAIAAAVLRKWRLAFMVPALIVIDCIYRLVFVHAFVKAVRQPRVASCRWDSPTRYS